MHFFPKISDAKYFKLKNMYFKISFSQTITHFHKNTYMYSLTMMLRRPSTYNESRIRPIISCLYIQLLIKHVMISFLHIYIVKYILQVLECITFYK